MLTRDYSAQRIRIAFQPIERRFEVYNPAIAKDSSWIPDIADIVSPDTRISQVVKAYIQDNENVDEADLEDALEALRGITTSQIGVIELIPDLTIEEVTEIFIRVNSTATQLSQADFAMSKIAVNESLGGHLLRKAIDYFCHISNAPGFIDNIEVNDPDFRQTEYFPKMRWLRNQRDNIYIPNYTDMLRVAFTSRFNRGRMEDCVALLSGRNFETREYEQEIAEDSFRKLREGVLDFINQTHFERLTMILRSAGFVTDSLVRSHNSINSAYILYLRGRQENIPPSTLAKIIRRWYAMALLRQRYTGNPETAFDNDIRQIDRQGLESYVDMVIENELPDSFWSGVLLQHLTTSSTNSPYFAAYQAAGVKLDDRGFLSANITVRDMLLNRGDNHHIYPAGYLKQNGLSPSQYNQIANLVPTQSEINIKIGDKSPSDYFEELADQCRGGEVIYGDIQDEKTMRQNFRVHCLPEGMLNGDIPDYDAFLDQRRHFMAQKIEGWFKSL